MSVAIPCRFVNPQLESIVARMASLESLVQEELADYQQVPAFSDELSGKLVTVVIPVFNEELSVARVISRVAALPFKKEIIVIDDASTDKTRSILERFADVPGVKLVFKERNAGKGAALRDGFRHATGEIVLVQDADLEYDPRDLPQLIRPILQDEADVVFGSRYIGRETTNDDSLVHRWGNWLLTESSNLFTGTRLTDMETCYKVFRRSVLKDLPLRQDRFGIEPELTAKVVRRGYRIIELPIRYRARSYREGKKIGVRDLFKTLYCIVRYGICD